MIIHNKAPDGTLMTPRQSDIVDLAHDLGRVNVEDLAQHFSVTPQTIRKDLNELCESGVLQRVHGGATLSTRVSNVGYGSRRTTAAGEKRRIGLKASSLIPNNCSLFINIGTTTEQVAISLINKKNILAITNNINVVNILLGSPGVEVIVASGVVRHTDGGVIGESASDFIRQFMVDFAIIGVSGIGQDGSLLDFDYREVKIAQAIIENSRHTILVADSMKFERTAPVRMGHISQIDTFVTDRPLPPALARICKDNDVSVTLTD